MNIESVDRRVNRGSFEIYKTVINGEICWVPNDPKNSQFIEMQKQIQRGTVVPRDVDIAQVATEEEVINP